jgi:asparagine synthase (glutamine-hydrolysing)
MCGIAGIALRERSPIAAEAAADVVRRMTDRLAHRGPDGEGLWRSDGCVLGHRRLAIIDRAGGYQPMGNEDGSVVITCNGEVYNHLELRRRAEERGHRFATRCDTEAILHLSEIEGLAALPELSGMFAFGLYDQHASTLLLARDRMGKKPLYYAEVPEGLAFASELKALLCHPAVSRDLDLVALRQYLLLDYIPAPRTIFGAVKKLPAGSWLRWRQGEMTTGRYYAPGPLPITDLRDEPLYAELRRLLVSACETRLMSEVPLGVLLSGGIDSSAVVAALAQCVDPRGLRTFSIAFQERSFDESIHARAVARHFGTQHREFVCRAEDALGILPALTQAMDEPFADASLLPTALLCQRTREHVTVALGGDGGDELFGGYDTFVAEDLAGLATLVPGPLLRLVERLVALVPASTRNLSLEFKLKRFLSALEADPSVRQWLWLSSVSPSMQDELLTQAAGPSSSVAELIPTAGAAWARGMGSDRLTRVMLQYLELYLPEDILTKVDRASMLFSLEVRAPFLDRDVVAFAMALPSRQKIRYGRTKIALRNAVSPWLPKAIVRRRKKGFGLPVSAWIDGPLASLIARPVPDVLKDYIRNETKARWVAEHGARRHDRHKALWAIFMLEEWATAYL